MLPTSPNIRALPHLWRLYYPSLHYGGSAFWWQDILNLVPSLEWQTKFHVHTKQQEQWQIISLKLIPGTNNFDPKFSFLQRIIKEIQWVNPSHVLRILCFLSKQIANSHTNILHKTDVVKTSCHINFTSQLQMIHGMKIICRVVMFLFSIFL
jgi:hypothetical protein